MKSGPVWGVTLRGFLLFPLIPVATTPSFRGAPRAGTGSAGRSEARSHARTPSSRLPLSSLPSLSTSQAVSAPLPGRGRGSEAPLRVWFGSLWRFGAVRRVKSASCPEKKLEMQVAALSRGYAGAPGLAILPQGVCEREWPCPVLQVPTKSRAWARGDGPGSGSRFPAQLSTPWQFSVQIRRTQLPRR